MREYPKAMVAIVTPFDGALNIDAEAHRSNITKLTDLGCGGFVVAGSTGEGPYLEQGERQLLVSESRAAAPDAYIVCGINAESIRQACAQIDEAAAGGADAVLVLSPGTLVRGRTDLVSSFYTAVADAATLPVMLYSNPKVTGYELPTDAINELANHTNIVGLKDSGGDPTRITHLAQPIEHGFIVYPGASRALLDSYRAGAFGAITASANYAFGLVSAASQGDAAAQADLDKIIAVVEAHGIPGAKRAADSAGLTGGRPRPPLGEVSHAVGIEIDEALAFLQQH